MNDLLSTLLSQKPVILDGGWGTQLQNRGLPVGACPDEWNLSEPEKVGEVAAAYVEAGSDIILTNTFGASRLMLAKHGLGDKAVAINKAGVEVSKKAAGDAAKVFASIGPCGEMLLMGNVTPEQMRDAFLEQATAMAEAGADGIVIETMADPGELQLAIAAAKETGLPVVGCMVFDSGADKDRTMMGTTIEDAAKAIEEAGADVVGSNCGQGIAGFVTVCERLAKATSLPLWVKGNAGLPEMTDGVATYRQTPAQFAEFIPRLVEAGASFIGGCCGTSPDFIREVCRTVK